MYIAIYKIAPKTITCCTLVNNAIRALSTKINNLHTVS